jgi:hypothetical protein
MFLTRTITREAFDALASRGEAGAIPFGPLTGTLAGTIYGWRRESRPGWTGQHYAYLTAPSPGAHRGYALYLQPVNVAD